MRNNPENIEERLIPFVEGVLNAREENEVREAVQADPSLMREVEELRGVVDELRAAFASGVQPSQSAVTPEEVVETSFHDGKIETMPGSSELKTRLFTSDQALEEYRLLQQLREDGAHATIDMSDIPPMPESLLEEFRKLRSVERPKVVPLPTGPSFWERSAGYLERINPRPLMAVAAAFAVISLGIQFSVGPESGRSTSQSPELVGYAATTPELDTAQPMGGAGPNPSGVPVFTSSDKKLLREQAQKLLANDIRYTVVDNRIIVAEKELGSARKVLWGEEGEQTVAIAEENKKERIQKPGERLDETLARSDFDSPATPDEIALDLDQEDGAINTPMRVVDLRDKGSEREPVVEPDPGFSQPPAPKPNPPAAPPQTVQKRPSGPSASVDSKAAPANESPEERRERLRRLALGESTTDSSQVSFTRSRTAPPVPAVERSAPVPNVVTAPSSGGQPATDGTPREVRQSAVAVNPADGAPAPSRVDIDRLEVESDSSSQSSASYTSEGSRPGAARKPAVTVQQSETNVLINSQRLADIRDAQPAVARKYNVVISVEQRGNQINVYVRPKGELDKNQLDQLRQAIRSELGLDESDSIIFQ